MSAFDAGTLIGSNGASNSASKRNLKSSSLVSVDFDEAFPEIRPSCCVTFASMSELRLIDTLSAHANRYCGTPLSSINSLSDTSKRKNPGHFLALLGPSLVRRSLTTSIGLAVNSTAVQGSSNDFVR